MHRTTLATALASAAALLVAAPAGAATFTVKNFSDAGVESLRAAIVAANTTPGDDDITFDIPGAGPHVIALASSLPAITESVRIDGTTQPGGGTTPRIEINAAMAQNGLVLIADDNLVRGLAINGAGTGAGAPANEGNAILLASDQNHIERNHLGTDASGNVALGNLNHGLRIAGNQNMIGAPYDGAGNVISGNFGDGVRVVSGAGNQLWGNRIGVNVTGGSGLANIGSGVHVRASNTLVGGGGSFAANIISGNGLAGVRIGAGTGTRVVANTIGVDRKGSVGVPNGAGVEVGSDGNLVESNHVAGNIGPGIELRGDDNDVVANRVGTDAAGTVALPNEDGVVVFRGRYNTIESNRIAFNTGNGVLLDNSVPPGTLTTATANRVRANTIEANGASGVFIDSADGNLIDGGNTITLNGGDGVTVDSGTDNTISRNSITANTGLGIDLNDDGVSFNDPLDADLGANLTQNRSIITSAVVSGLNVNVSWTFDGAPSRSFRLKLFVGPACDGEGRSFVRSIDINTDATGHSAGVVAVKHSGSQAFTATATSLVTFSPLLPLRPASTSEFSPCVVAA